MQYVGQKQGVKLKESPYKEYNFDSDVVITDHKGNNFELFFGGNLDLYLIPEIPFEKLDEKTTKLSYILENDNSLLYYLFDDLFSEENKQNKRYAENFEGEKLCYFSDNDEVEKANKVEIYKGKTGDQQAIILDFIKGEESIYNMGLDIRLRCSGARNFEFVHKMLTIYNELKAKEKYRLSLMEQRAEEEKDGQLWLDMEI